MNWIISDTHFNHKGISVWGGRPPDHKEQTIASMRSLIKPGDTLFHLGDVIFSKQGELTEILNSIHGTKILVRGNHDTQKNRWYLNHGFSAVVNRAEVSCDGEKFLLTHIPVPVSEFGCCAVNIHGHLHNTAHRNHDLPKDWDPGYTHLLFILENGYYPRQLGEFIQRERFVQRAGAPCPG